jgi:hypothetical protein
MDGEKCMKRKWMKENRWREVDGERLKERSGWMDRGRWREMDGDKPMGEMDGEKSMERWMERD